MLVTRDTVPSILLAIQYKQNGWAVTRGSQNRLYLKNNTEDVRKAEATPSWK